MKDIGERDVGGGQSNVGHADLYDMTTFVIDALAVFRLTRLVTRDDITAGVRARVKHAMHQETRSAEIAAKLDALIACPWCASPYAAIFIMCIGRTSIGRSVNKVLAFSAVAGLLSTFVAEYE